MPVLSSLSPFATAAPLPLHRWSPLWPLGGGTNLWSLGKGVCRVLRKGNMAGLVSSVLAGSSGLVGQFGALVLSA